MPEIFGHLPKDRLNDQINQMPRTGPERSATPSSLEIRLLGPFRIIVDGTTIDERRFTRRKPKLLIKLLALQPHHQLHREQAMELLWPDSEPDSATNNLHKAIHLVRHALEPALKSAADSHFILTQGQQILLRAPERLWIDVEAFENALTIALKDQNPAAFEAALALYGSDLLAEDRYEDWAATRREQLRGHYQDLLAKLAHLYDMQGQSEPAIESFRKLVSCDPANEEAHRRLMRLYALTGSKNRALRQYQECCDALQRELDAQPERATFELREQIFSGQLAPLATSETARDERDRKTINSLAILPLVNAGADPNAEYLSDGITESIINNLSQLPGLRVMSWGSVTRYKGHEVDPQGAGRELRVRAIVRGKVLQLEDRLIIRTELVDTKDGAQLWGEQYDRKFVDVLAVQEDIANRISETLQLKLSGEEHVLLTRRQTQNTEAYQAYLRGLFFWNKRTEGGLMHAIEHFLKAAEKDPEYALAHALLACSYALLSWYSVLAPRESFPKAKASASRALHLDSGLAEALVSSAWVKFSFDWDYSGAEKDLKAGIRLNPQIATPHQWYSHYLSAMERHSEAIEEIEKARLLDPLSLVINRDVGWVFYYARQYARAVEAYQRTMELAPSFYIAHYFFGETYEQMGRRTEAISEFRETRSHSKEGTQVWTLLAQARANALLGKEMEARAVIEELIKLSTEHYVSPYLIAIVYTSLRDTKEALRWLETAYQERDSYLVHLRIEPTLDALRTEPRFANLVQRVGLGVGGEG